MSRLKWYKRDPEKWFAALGKLSLDERAVLPHLIDLMHITEDNVEDDDREISYKLRVDIRRWRKVKASLMASNWIYIDNGMIRNRDMSDSIAVALESYERLSNHNREAGAKSGLVRRGNNRLAEHGVEQIEEYRKRL